MTNWLLIAIAELPGAMFVVAIGRFIVKNRRQPIGQHSQPEVFTIEPSCERYAYGKARQRGHCKGD